MQDKERIYRTDAELTGMLDQHGTWVVHGPNNRVIGIGTSLRRALDRARGHRESGTMVATVTRVPPNRIFVFHDQIARLIEATEQRERTAGGTSTRKVRDSA
jgi:hypothetical protein